MGGFTLILLLDMEQESGWNYLFQVFSILIISNPDVSTRSLQLTGNDPKLIYECLWFDLNERVF